MSARNSEIRPGWKMTWAQSWSYVRMWNEIRRATGWENTREARLDWHEASGLGRCSAKDINHLKGFDALKIYWLAVTKPANLNEQMRMQEMPKHRLKTRIRGMTPEAYWSKIARDKYGTDDLDGLNEKELIDLRNTLEARTAKPKTVVECPF